MKINENNDETPLQIRRQGYLDGRELVCKTYKGPFQKEYEDGYKHGLRTRNLRASSIVAGGYELF